MNLNEFRFLISRRVPSGWPGLRTDTLASQRKLPSDRKSTRLNSSHLVISYAVFCLKKKKYAGVLANNDLTVISGFVSESASLTVARIPATLRADASCRGPGSLGERVHPTLRWAVRP